MLMCLGLALFPACAQKAGQAGSQAGVKSETPEPPIPKGFATEDEVKQALLTGKVGIINRNPPIPDEIKRIQDVEYFNVDGHSLKLDLFVPRQPKGPVPALVFIHGGGWVKGDRKDYLPYNVEFAKKGYVTATISYRLIGVSPYPACVKDVKCAIKFLRQNAAQYSIDPDRIVAIGGSAGGHLSMMLGYAPNAPEFDQGCYPGVSDAVQAVVDLYGPTDLTATFAQHNPTANNFIGKSFEAAPELYSQASPITWLNAGDPPTLIFQGTIDSTVPASQSDLLASKLKSLGIPYEYEKYEGWPHTMDLAQPVYDRTTFVIARFLEKHVGGPTVKK
jgi:acetyl esterase/lipase